MKYRNLLLAACALFLGINPALFQRYDDVPQSVFAACVFFLGINPAFLQENLCQNFTCGYLARCGNTTDAQNGYILTCVCKKEFRGQRLELLTENNTSLLYCREHCSRDNSSCNENTTCKAIPKLKDALRCLCDEGYERSATGQCVDIDECVSSPDICGQHGVCTNTVGNYTCGCEEGFTPREDHRLGCVTEKTETAQDSHQMLIIGLASGVGGAVLCTVFLVVVCIFMRRKRRSNKQKIKRSAELKDQQKEASDVSSAAASPNAATSNHGDLARREQVERDPSGPVVDVCTQHSETFRSEVYPLENRYEIVDEEGLQKNDTDAGEVTRDLYSNYTIPGNKIIQNMSKRTNHSGHIQDNDYNILYGLNSGSTNGDVSSIQLVGTGSVELKTGDVVTKGENDSEYDHLTLERV